MKTCPCGDPACVSGTMTRPSVRTTAVVPPPASEPAADHARLFGSYRNDSLDELPNMVWSISSARPSRSPAPVPRQIADGNGVVALQLDEAPSNTSAIVKPRAGKTSDWTQPPAARAPPPARATRAKPSRASVRRPAADHALVLGSKISTVVVGWSLTIVPFGSVIGSASGRSPPAINSRPSASTANLGDDRGSLTLAAWLHLLATGSYIEVKPEGPSGPGPPSTRTGPSWRRATTSG